MLLKNHSELLKSFEITKITIYDFKGERTSCKVDTISLNTFSRFYDDHIGNYFWHGREHNGVYSKMVRHDGEKTYALETSRIEDVEELEQFPTVLRKQWDNGDCLSIRFFYKKINFHQSMLCEVGDVLVNTKTKKDDKNEESILIKDLYIDTKGRTIIVFEQKGDTYHWEHKAFADHNKHYRYVYNINKPQSFDYNNWKYKGK